MKCRACNNPTNTLLDMSHIPISVTSDCRIVNQGIKLYICSKCHLIQKESSPISQQNLFEKFHSHTLKQGEEQVKFVDGIPYPRSKLIIDAIKPYIDKSGKLLDIGTGSGSFLKSFKQEIKNYELFAQDIQDNSKDKILETIPASNLFINEISKINMSFNLISLIHVLGHISNLQDFIKSLKNILDNNGKLIIQTPDLESSFFDIVIIDQITHFSKYTLLNTLNKSFKNISFLDSVNKEITLCINMNNKIANLINEKKDMYKLSNQFKLFIEYLIEVKEPMIVFGCAPVSTYIAAVINNKLKCFIDEDDSLIGQKHLEKDIKHPFDIKDPSLIILPFIQEDIIHSIKKRYNNHTFITINSIKDSRRNNL